jgi:fructose-1,6-bisphosphatase/inositol monophosphatase family enzyme
LCRRQREESTISCEGPHRRERPLSCTIAIAGAPPDAPDQAEVQIMENGARYSLRLFGAACLTFCGLAAVAVGAGIGALPRPAQICASSVTDPCCGQATSPKAAHTVAPVVATDAPASEAD